MNVPETLISCRLVGGFGTRSLFAIAEDILPADRAATIAFPSLETTSRPPTFAGQAHPAETWNR